MTGQQAGGTWVGIKAIAGLVGSLWASIPVAISTLVVLAAVDYVTGVLAAVVRREVSAAVGWGGLIKKALMLILVATVHWVSRPLGLPIDLGAALALAFGLNELFSLVENCHRAGVPIPGVLVRALAAARRVAGEDGEVAAK